MLKSTPTKLKEVLVLEYDSGLDNRGSSHKIFSKRELTEAGITTEFIEETIYCPSAKGTIYGIHFQNHPMAQAKLLYCIKGRGLDFAVDLRRDSQTYKEWICVEISPENRKQIYIPSGFGHAFLSLEDNTEVVMKIDNEFHPDYRRAIMYNDPELNLQFPVDKPVLSEMDRHAPCLKDSDCNL